MVYILWIAWLLVCSSYITGPIVDPDLWWHLAAGRWILAHHALPDVDYWNLFGAGKPWVAYSWLAEIVFAWFYQIGELKALLLLKLASAFLIVASLVWCLSKVAKDFWIGGLLGALVSASLVSHFTLRPQSIVWILFTWLLWHAWNISQSAEQKSRLGTLASVLLVFSLWSNLHITFALGLLSLVLLLWDTNPKRAIAWLGIGFVGTLINPYGYKVWTIFLSKTDHPFKFHNIAEFQPANIFQFPTAFMLLLLVLYALTSLELKKKVRAGELLVISAFVGLSLSVVKFLPFANIYLSFLIAAKYRERTQIGANAKGVLPAFVELRKVVEKIPREGLSFVLLCLTALNLFKVWNSPFASWAFPVKAMDYIESENLPFPILNAFGDGGYLIFRLSDQAGNPRELVAIDGRTNVTPGHVMQAYTQALTGQQNWHDVMDLVKPNTVLWRNESPLISILLLSPEWERVYSDSGQSSRDGYSVFVRRGG